MPLGVSVYIRNEYPEPVGKDGFPDMLPIRHRVRISMAFVIIDTKYKAVHKNARLRHSPRGRDHHRPGRYINGNPQEPLCSQQPFNGFERCFTVVQ